jgi:pantoate--beta-alanine ligase
MEVIATIEQVRTIRRQQGAATLGFVPTMGYLHEGHLELVRRARRENDLTAVSIYVNPTQFAPTEDLSRYPRDLERDLALLRAEGVAFVFTPDDTIMYPPGFQTRVRVSDLTQPLEGARRPTHFEGVTTVVAKLFNVVQPTRAYFGQKDAQQAAVIRQMARDLAFNLEVVVCPTVREADGLAMSSRNKYLNAEQRPAATALYRALQAAERLWLAGGRDANDLRDAMRAVLDAEPLAEVDYVSAADPLTLAEWPAAVPPGGGVLLSLAVRFGGTRLIDNFLLADEAAA